MTVINNAGRLANPPKALVEHPSIKGLGSEGSFASPIVLNVNQSRTITGLPTNTRVTYQATSFQQLPVTRVTLTDGILIFRSDTAGHYRLELQFPNQSTWYEVETLDFRVVNP
jgi:hypothetical protein